LIELLISVEVETDFFWFAW